MTHIILDREESEKRTAKWIKDNKKHPSVPCMPEEHKKAVARNNLAKAFIIVGVVFTLTLLGAMVGIPCLVIGLVLYYDNKKHNPELKRYAEELEQEEQLQFQNRQPSKYTDNLAIQILHNTPPERKKGIRCLLLLFGFPTFYIMSPIWKRKLTPPAKGEE